MDRDEKFLGLLADWALARDAARRLFPEPENLREAERTAEDALLGYVTALRAENAHLLAIVDLADRALRTLERDTAETNDEAHEYRTARAALDAKEGGT